ncbi:CLUMA_CG006102, isoform A [Clunio marinus]|uniref:CLUMA_CG006102, isoform A n=1 Tax=Clunio marinus TaxID=568069 RepID=A0A1J1HWS5_9DIPT|nr:CLUMA_CG006102, isoform A [Clunio marinus]
MWDRLKTSEFVMFNVMNFVLSTTATFIFTSTIYCIMPNSSQLTYTYWCLKQGINYAFARFQFFSKQA